MGPPNSSIDHEDLLRHGIIETTIVRAETETLEIKLIKLDA
jgi:hypothetical protein